MCSCVEFINSIKIRPQRLLNKITFYLAQKNKIKIIAKVVDKNFPKFSFHIGSIIHG